MIPTETGFVPVFFCGAGQPGENVMPYTPFMPQISDLDLCKSPKIARSY